MSNEIDLVWKVLFLDLGEDGSELSKSVYSDVNRADDDAPHPVANFLDKAAFDRAMGKTSGADWDEEISTALPIAKAESDDTSDYYSLGEWIGLRKSVRRTEQVVVDGEEWIHGFNAAGELVDIQWQRSA